MFFKFDWMSLFDFIQYLLLIINIVLNELIQKNYHCNDESMCP